MSIDVFAAYLAAVAIIVAVPGPNIVLIINDSIRNGFKSSILTIIGIKAGTSLLVLLSLSGMSALMALCASMFSIMKWVGAGYLVYLGVTRIIFSFKPELEAGRAGTEKNNRFFLKGFLVSVTNPKGLLFAGAFFPQFLNRDMAIGPQIVMLFAGFLIVSFIIEVAYAAAADSTGKLFNTARFKRMVERVSGALLVMFGIGLSLVKENNS